MACAAGDAADAIAGGGDDAVSRDVAEVTSHVSVVVAARLVGRTQWPRQRRPATRPHHLSRRGYLIREPIAHAGKRERQMRPLCFHIDS